MEHQCWSNDQYSKHECLGLVGVHHSDTDSSLEKMHLKIFLEIGCSIEENSIGIDRYISKKLKSFQSNIFFKKTTKIYIMNKSRKLNMK